MAQTKRPAAAEPDYNKPDSPGIWMNFDNTVSIYHVVEPHHTFEKAAQELFGAVQDAERQFPGWPRVLYLDIAGHTDALGRHTPDMVELQQEFLFSTIGPFLTAVETPLVSAVNPERQRNDVPNSLAIGTDEPTVPTASCG
jgi:hypothetical protein